jgi:3-isopropylmalate/(R)-2-methylmalate dehydratase large subunit
MRVQVAGATYRAMEFAGETLDAMNMDERMTICNMAVEAGGKNGVIAPDQTTFDYVDTRNPGYQYTPQYADSTANYLREYTIDVSKLQPLVAAPHSPDNRETARECADVAIDHVYIGSCTGAHRVKRRLNLPEGLRPPFVYCTAICAYLQVSRFIICLIAKLLEWL